jgi:hypothetical protein
MDDPGLRRISLVTRRYGDLRGGVTRAIWAPCILSVGAVEYFNIHRGLRGVIFGLLNIFSWAGVRLAWTAAGLIDLALLFKVRPQRPQEAISVDAS